MQMTITPLPAPVRPRKALLILMYHHIGPFTDVTRQHHVYCDVNQFAAQMAYLDRSSLSVISMDRAIESLTGRAPLERRSVVLTFDDGFQNFHDFAWPILKKHDFPATLYAISDYLGLRQDWPDLPAYGTGRFMNAATLRTLADDGLCVGGHTATHPHLNQLPPARRDAEIRDAKKRLEDTLGREVRHFAYPFGAYDEDARDRVAEAGYVSAVRVVNKRAERAPNLFEIPRLCINYTDSLWRYRYRTRWRRYRLHPHRKARWAHKRLKEKART